jgi:hypothetical protein
MYLVNFNKKTYIIDTYITYMYISICNDIWNIDTMNYFISRYKKLKEYDKNKEF